jgi:hypothetical protein
MGSSAIVEANNNDKLFITSVSLRDTCSLISDLRLGDLNYLESGKPTPRLQRVRMVNADAKQPSPYLLMADSIRPIGDLGFYFF